MNIQHSSLPWKVSNDDTIVGPSGNVIAECKGYSVRARDNDQRRQGGRETNAEFIVCACNAHYDLLEACKEVQKLIRLARNYFPKSIQNSNSFALENTNAVICAAIAKAEGKESQS